MHGGSFPNQHPCHDDPNPTVMGKYCKINDTVRTEIPGEQPESDTALGRFRSKGYWASCFPEGDGISFEPLCGQSDDEVMSDIAECFDVLVVSGSAAVQRARDGG